MQMLVAAVAPRRMKAKASDLSNFLSVHGVCSDEPHLQPSMGMATRWQTKTVMPMAKGAKTCRVKASFSPYSYAKAYPEKLNCVSVCMDFDPRKFMRKAHFHALPELEQNLGCLATSIGKLEFLRYFQDLDMVQLVF